MQDILGNQWLWTVILGVALFLPVRQLIWAMAVRRDERRPGHAADDSRRQALKRRASITAALLCFVFSVVYVNVMFTKIYGQP